MAAYETCSKESWKLYWLRDNCFTIQSSHLDNLQGSNNASNGKLLRFFSANISLVTGEMLHFLFSHHQGTVSIQPTTNASLSSAPNLKRPCWRLFTRPKRVAATAAYSGKDVRKKRWELERKKKEGKWERDKKDGPSGAHHFDFSAIPKVLLAAFPYPVGGKLWLAP